MLDHGFQVLCSTVVRVICTLWGCLLQRLLSPDAIEPWAAKQAEKLASPPTAISERFVVQAAAIEPRTALEATPTTSQHMRNWYTPMNEDLPVS